MKILKYSVITFLVLFLAYISIGLFNPTFTYSNKIEVKSTIEHAWSVFTDKNLMKEWMLDLKKVETITGNEQEVGSEFEFTFEQNGEIMVVSEVIKEIREGEYYSFDLSADVLTASTEITFSQDGGNVMIESVTEVRPKGLILKPFFFLMRSTFKEQSDQQYLALGNLIENTSQN